MDVLSAFRLLRSDVIAQGGNGTQISEKLHQAFRTRDWIESSFSIKQFVEQKRRIKASGGKRTEERVVKSWELASVSHNVDCCKGRVALEIEWNSKDSVFVRDLSLFSWLHQIRAISVGVIITRSDELQTTFNSLGVGGKYGAATTHMQKLRERAGTNAAGSCPVLAFGIMNTLYDPGA